MTMMFMERQVSWGLAAARMLEATSWRYHDGGAGFSAKGQNGYTFSMLVDKAYVEHKTADMVIIGGGYNDHMAAFNTTYLKTAATALANKVTAKWPDAEVYVFVNLWGNGKNTTLGNAHTAAADTRAAAIRAGFESVGSDKIHVCTDCWSWIYTMADAVSRDNIHPLTLGHLDLIGRAAEMFDKVYVGVLVNPYKKSLFSVEERVIMIRRVTTEFPQVEVVSFGGLLIDFCHRIGVNHILRGLRDASDFEAEIKVAQGLKVLDPRLDTVFLGTDTRYAYLSSSMVREVASGGGDVSAFVPEGFAPLVAEKYKSFDRT